MERTPSMVRIARRGANNVADYVVGTGASAAEVVRMFNSSGRSGNSVKVVAYGVQAEDSD